MKKQAVKKLIISGLALGASIVLLVTAVLAWFIISRFNTVNGMELQVKTAVPSLYVSLEYGKDYKTNIILDSSTKTSIEEGYEADYLYIDTEDNNKEITKTAATWGEIIGHSLKLSDVTWKDNTFLDKGDHPALKNVEYLEFPLYFRASDPGYLIIEYFDKDKPANAVTTVTPKGEDVSHLKLPFTWSAFPAGYYTESAISMGNPNADPVIEPDKLTTRAAYASRIMFKDNSNKIFAGNPTLGTKIWEPNSSAGFGWGYQNTKYPASDPASIFDGKPVNLAQDYYNHWMGRSEYWVSDYENSVLRDSAIDGYGNTAPKLAQFKLNADFYECAIIVSVWIEGNDADCLNAILSDLFNVSLRFSLDVTP